MTSCQFCKHLTFDDERVWTRYVNEYDGQLLARCGLRGDVDRDRNRASIRLPTLQCIKACEGQQRSPTVPHLKYHERHLRLFVRGQPADRFAETSGGGDHRHKQSIPAESGNGS